MNILNYLMIQYELMNDNEIGYIIKALCLFIMWMIQNVLIFILLFIRKQMNTNEP